MTQRVETNRIIVHCSATSTKKDIGVSEIRDWHVGGRGWLDIGYHYVVRRNGDVEAGRDKLLKGAHALGNNDDTLSICMVGGTTKTGKSSNNFTDAQFKSLKKLVKELMSEFDIPVEGVMGHRDLYPDIDNDGVVESHEWLKKCPSFSVSEFMK